MNTGFSDPADDPSSGTELDQVIRHVINKASATSISIDHEPLQVALFHLPDDERARSSASKYIEALGLEESVKQIARYIAMSQCLDTMDLDTIQGILDFAVAQINQKRRKKETEVEMTYTSAAARCLKSLSFPEMGAREANIERPAKNTCNWIYTNPMFERWDLNRIHYSG
jgi:hypothetical protein